MPIIMKSSEIRKMEIQELTKRCHKLRKKNIIPSLKVILVGNNQASIKYTNAKKIFCEKIGAQCEIIKLEETISDEKFISKLNEITLDKSVHGCLIQLPLPQHLSKLDFKSLIPQNMDVDGFNYSNIGRLFYHTQENKTFVPCTPKGIIEILKYYNIKIAEQHVVIIGRSQIVGRPLSLIFLNNDATVTICHSKTKNLSEITKSADIIISAIGKTKFINLQHINKNKKQVIVDVGINHDEQGKLCGDVNFEEVLPHVYAITPVPGGVGPMTVLSVAQNLLQAAESNI